jgi:hypothetical protein
VRRLDQRVTVILDEGSDRREQIDYRPQNVSATTLPVFE